MFLAAVTAESAPIWRGWPQRSGGLSSDSEDSNSRRLSPTKGSRLIGCNALGSETIKMAKLSISFFGGVTGSLIKWALIGVLWLGSIVFVTTSALALDAISDVMMRLAGIPTLHLDQKRKVAKANNELQAQKNQAARAKNQLAEDRVARKKAVLRHRKKSGWICGENGPEECRGGWHRHATSCRRPAARICQC